MATPIKVLVPMLKVFNDTAFIVKRKHEDNYVDQGGGKMPRKGGLSTSSLRR